MNHAFILYNLKKKSMNVTKNNQIEKYEILQKSNKN